MQAENRRRVVIEHIEPEIDCGRFPIKRVAGEKVIVTADIFADGQDVLSARLRYKRQGDSDWREARMSLLENDKWKGEFVVTEAGIYRYLVEGWVDPFRTWRNNLRKKTSSDKPLEADLQIGSGYVKRSAEEAPIADKEKLLALAGLLKGDRELEEILTGIFDEETERLMDRYGCQEFVASNEKELTVMVDRGKVLFSAWYELFPRSCSGKPGKHGTFKDCEAILPEIARMGFDTLYLSPIHPIGRTNRKGKNNTLEVQPHDVGSPWAIGSEDGGHKAVHPCLGTLGDFERLVQSARGHGIEIALDLAFQCSPDHPYIREHPEWFKWRHDGTIQYAENPPKKYEDIIPFNFESEKWISLWEELKSVVLFWAERGVLLFRVDNPHTKPFAFWEWLIGGVKERFPGVIFLSEAFTRPKVMYRLAKAGFSQSYTYFTWRNTKRELTEYLTELTQTEVREYFRPNFWPNTPDILPEYLQYGGRRAFMIRLVLAATLSSNYGIYGPAFELGVNEAIPGTEEYLGSEKYEVKHWDRDRDGNIKDFIGKVNRIRRENKALQTTWNLRFSEVDDDSLIGYLKTTDDLSNTILVIVNLDPFHTHSGWVDLSLSQLGIDSNQPYLVHDLLSDDKHIWQGQRNFVEINPRVTPAKIFRIRKRLKREMDFDYFM